jgi:hypothetical protein
MKLQRRFAPISGEFTPESVARFIGIRMLLHDNDPAKKLLSASFFDYIPTLFFQKLNVLFWRYNCSLYHTEQAHEHG